MTHERQDLSLRRAGTSAAPLVRRLEAFGPLGPGVAAALKDAVARAISRPAGAPLTRSDDPPSPRVILSGWAGQELVLPDSRRQVLRVLMPGDLIGLHPLAARNAWGVTAATPVVLGDASALAVEAAKPDGDPGLKAFVAAAADQEDAETLNQVLRLGRLSALQRMAHFLLELYERAEAAGLGQGDRCEMPLRQELIADVLGLSIVHVNRTIQTLRRDRLIKLRGGTLEIVERATLEALSGFRGRSGRTPRDQVEGARSRGVAAPFPSSR